MCVNSEILTLNRFQIFHVHCESMPNNLAPFWIELKYVQNIPNEYPLSISPLEPGNKSNNWLGQNGWYDKLMVVITSMQTFISHAKTLIFAISPEFVLCVPCTCTCVWLALCPSAMIIVLESEVINVNTTLRARKTWCSTHFKVRWHIYARTTNCHAKRQDVVPCVVV